jgi:hypothetical protein
MAMCAHCHSEKPFAAPVCHACNNDTPFMFQLGWGLFSWFTQPGWLLVIIVTVLWAVFS